MDWLSYGRALALGGITALSIPAVKSFLSRESTPSQATNQNRLYQDEDGQATKESEAACSDATPRAVISLAVAVGLSAAVYSARISGTADWPSIYAWVLLSMQALAISLETQQRQRYSCGIVCALSAALRLSYSIYKPFQPSGFARLILERVATITIIIASLSIPKRPVVYFKGLRIDQEFGVSFLSRLSFSWDPFHESGSHFPENMTMDDLPDVGHLVRVETLKRQLKQRAGHTTSLWKQLLLALLPWLTQQWLFIFFNAFSEFGSRFALFKLLQCLERHDPSSAWTWAIVMGGALVVDTVSASWVVWVSQMRLHLPAEQLLKALVLEKTTRRQLVAEKTKEADGPQGVPSLTDLVSTDCMETASAFGHIRYFVKAAFKILLDVAYLSQLLGIKSILVGAAAAAISSPVSSRLSKRHGALRRDVLKSHDGLSKLISEALTGLGQIRLSSMEQVWQKRLLEARSQELDKMWKAGVALASLTFVTNLGPILLVSLALSVYSYDTGRLSASVAFVSLNLFGNLYTAFQDLPSKVSETNVSWVSCQRIQRYLDSAEQTNTATPSDQISLDCATFAWPTENGSSSFSLREVNVSFPKGKLSIVTGKTGSGKGLLLAAILDEAKRESGQLFKPSPSGSNEKRDILAGTVAFVSQPPWIEDCTVKENVVFGYAYDAERYQKVLHACALDKDLGILPDGDQTRAGLNGAVLSGGQKWRVALARAMYSPAEILVFEDVLSAVDAPVANWICTNALTGELAKERTIILVTHQPSLCLAAASYLVVVEDGTVHGSKPELLKIEDEKVPDTLPIQSQAEKAQGSTPTTPNKRPLEPEGKHEIAARTSKQIFSAYVSATGGMWNVIIGIIVTLGYRVASDANSWWLAHWTENQNATTPISFNIAVYMALSIGSGIALTTKTLVLLRMSTVSSSTLFQGMVQSVLCAPLPWINSMPLGEMLQTLEHDMYSLDYRVIGQLNNLLGNLLHLLFIIVTSFWSAPQTAILSITILIAYYHTAHGYFTVSRRLQTLIDASMRPVLEHITSVAAGLATIRAFGRTQFYIDRMETLINSGTKLGWHLALGQRWLAVRLGSLGAVFVTATAGALVLQNADAAKAGFIISLALQLRGALSGALSGFNVRNLLQGTMGRIVSLAYTATEPQDGLEPPESWPAHGSLEVQDLTVSYDPSLPPALKSVSFAVKPRQRLGIIGRTGAGKTSLTNALLRFIDPFAGKVLIDGQDISKLKLKTLRNALALIPQDPFLFSGTLRSNITSTSINDAKLRSILHRVHLITDEDTKFSNLDMEIQPGGANLSHGQRQLVCLARALLAQCSILILDEATSAVDAATDAAIQQVLREDFSAATIIVVAHRLLTVADFDALLVMSNGEVAESGSPADLLDKKGMFYNMVQQSGDAEAIKSAITRRALHR